MSAGRELIVIGAGVAGLATGCYAQMNGYDVRILELHDKPGGMCTSWQRKGYTFDYCIHNLPGTASNSGFRRIWDELGALDGTDIVDRDEFVCVEDSSGTQFHWYADLDRLEEHLKAIAPSDGRLVDDLTGSARRLARADLLSMPLGGMRRTARVLPLLPTIKRWSQIMMGEFAGRFSDPFMRRAWGHAQYDIPPAEVPMIAPLLFMTGLHNGDLGRPVGGSLAFSKKIEQRFLDLGGELLYRSPVEKVLVENDRAVGVRLADGTEHRATRVISAADGYRTIYGMLDGRYLSNWITDYYADVWDVGPFGLTLYLGVNAALEGEPHALTLLLDEQIDLGEVRQDSLYISIFGSDTGLAPEGKAVVKVEVQASYPYWKALRDNEPAIYRNRKQQIADSIIERVAPRFRGLRDHIEVMDVATLATSERYTGNRFGAQAAPPKRNAAEIQRKGLSHTLPGLEAFYHVGQWSNATIGVGNAALTGRNLVRALCKKDGRRFAVV